MEESPEKVLRSSFVGAANQLTQLYTQSLNITKQAYSRGYAKGIYETLEFVLRKAEAEKTQSIDISTLVGFLKERINQVSETENLDSSQTSSNKRDEGPNLSVNNNSLPTPQTTNFQVPSYSTNSNSIFGHTSERITPNQQSSFDAASNNSGSSFSFSSSSTSPPFYFSSTPSSNGPSTRFSPSMGNATQGFMFYAPSDQIEPPSALQIPTNNSTFIPSQDKKRGFGEASMYSSGMDLSTSESLNKKTKINANF
jgi:hypothetical protein